MGIYSLANSSINNWTKYSNAAAGNGQTSDFELIGTQILTANAASITFANLQNYSQYKHLQLRIASKSIVSGNTDNIFIRFNADSTNNYSSHTLRGDGASSTSSAWTSQSGMYLPSQNPAAATTAANFGPTIVDILDAFSTTKNKTIRGFSGFTDSVYSTVALTSGAWVGLSAITSINLTNSSSFAIGSRFSLYGVK